MIIFFGKYRRHAVYHKTDKKDALKLAPYALNRCLDLPAFSLSFINQNIKQYLLYKKYY